MWSKAVRKETSKDAILRRVRDFVMRGWPDKVHDCLKPFHSRRLELTLEEDCVMWGPHYYIPQSLRANLLEEIHEAHLGVVKMKTSVLFLMAWFI